MHEFTSFKSRGQTMLLVALAAVAVVAFVALAVDGGSAYSLRRDAQSASDAGAIAGTWAMISLPPGADPQAPVLREANKAAEANGVLDTNGVPGDVINTHLLAYYVDQDGNRIDFPELHDAGGLPRPSTARGVEVVSTISQTTFFARAIGQDEVQATAPATARFKIDGGILPIAVNEYWTGSNDKCPYENCAPPYSYVRNPAEEAPFRTDDGGMTWVRNICADPFNNDTCQGPYEGYGENYGKAFAILGADAKPLDGSKNPRSGVVLNCRFDSLVPNGYWHELTGDNSWANPGQCAMPDGQGGDDMEKIIRAGGYDRVPLPAALNEPPSEFYEETWTYCWQDPPNEDNCFNWPEEDREQPYEVLQFLSGARAAQMAREKQYRVLDFWPALGRFFWRGLGVVAIWTLLFLAIYANVAFYRDFPIKWVAAVAGGLWFYLLLFFLMMQPYWFWWMTAEGKGLWRAAKAAAWQVLANPWFSILQLVMAALVLLAVRRWAALLFLVFGGLLALFGANAAMGAPLRYPAQTTDEKS